jgi:adenosylcobinamide kinase/adenosylcobinamide-phosphate guanylyltransferase
MPAGPLPQITLVLGGARSGKSKHAEALLARAPGPWTYVATAEARDDEMQARIARHKARRGADWHTLEVPLELADAVLGLEGQPALIDCLTLWLSNVLLAGRDVTAECARLTDALKAVRGPIVAVSNEVGLGIVPDNPLARSFRDAQGVLNQQVAAIAGSVILVTAGIPLTLK